MSDFEQLLATLAATAEEQSTLAKSMPAVDETDPTDNEDDDTVGAGDIVDEQPATAATAPAGEGEATETALTKSMVIDGEDVEVVEVGALIKSLSDLTTRVEGGEANLVKSLNPIVELIQGQNALIKSMQDQLTKLGGSGRGRKSVLAVAELPVPGETALTKSQQPTQIAPQQLLAKCLSAQAEGRISGVDVARVEAAINSGLAAPADVLTRI